MVVFYALFSTPFFDKLLYGYLQANAWMANAILSWLGQNTHVSDVVIQSPTFSIAIRRGCDAVEPTWLLCAAILAFQAKLNDKLLGMLIGIVLLQILNLVRIVTLYLIGIHWPSGFNSAHLEVWPILFILVAISLFATWVNWTSRSQPVHDPA